MLAKKLLRKKIKVNTKVTFDDDGESNVEKGDEAEVIVSCCKQKPL